METVKHDFYKIKVDVVDKKEFFSKVEEFYRSDEVHLINFLNAHCYNLACENTAYKDALLESSILFANVTVNSPSFSLIAIKPMPTSTPESVITRSEE